MKETVEFYNVDRDTWWKDDKGKSGRLDVKDYKRVKELFDYIERNYAECHAVLANLYRKSTPNTAWFRFLVVNRFVRCNFGIADNIPDIEDEGLWNLEYVQCPIRGECRLEGIVCRPKRTCGLTPAEERVMRLVCEGKGTEDIADRLCLSLFTVKKHMSNVYRKLGLKGRAEFAVYAERQGLWKGSRN